MIPQTPSQPSARVSRARGTAPTPVGASGTTGGANESADLTILAAASVIPAELCRFAVVRLLTGQAQANPGHGIPACVRSFMAAFRATSETRTLGQLALCPADPVRH